MTPVPSLEPLLPAYLARQRWFAGGEPDVVRVVESEELGAGLVWLLADAGDALYQLVFGTRPAERQPEFLHGHEAQVLGVVEDEVAFDASLDPEYARTLLGRVAPSEEVERVRPMGAEQSNTSLVFDDRLVMKLFRRIRHGPNPDVEMTTALAGEGFPHVAAPVGVWRRDDMDLAVCSRYLGGGAEGWALALTSLRDAYASGHDRPAECGGDFAGEACRLGEVTASMHLALADAFGTSRGDADEWAATFERQLAQLDEDDADRGAAKGLVGALRGLDDPGPGLRVHGDYHLGQVMRTDEGWFVLDFEGEPVRPLEERRRPSSPLKDVAGMARSLHYAAQVALVEQEQGERDELAAMGAAWEARNRSAFLEGYFNTPSVDRVLPAGRGRDVVLAAFELDKAAYEVLYERAYRPEWVPIPRAAIARLLNG